MRFDEINNLKEYEYSIESDGTRASLFTTGNGYMGIRGSYEEFGSIRVQGAYVRGYFGEIIEVVEPFPDNDYMKNYYFDEQALKEFEKQDSCINFADILFMQVSVSGETFYPWKGKLISWERYLDCKTAILYRNIVWENSLGEQTKITFERFASYHNVHKYCMKMTVTPLNRSSKITLRSGIDTLVKTGGQFVTEVHNLKRHNNVISYISKVTNSYKNQMAISVKNDFYVNDNLDNCDIKEYEQNGAFACEKEINAERNVVYSIEKEVCILSNIDCGKKEKQLIEELNNIALDTAPFEVNKRLHIISWEKYFRYFDIEIVGDYEADNALRFANYHTAISAVEDDVHSLSAKALTGEKYNNFVWWDCEIYQLPIFINAYPKIAKEALKYRYKLLSQAKDNATNQGYKGARYPFVSSVNGDEKVWKYARHPHLQIHINSDIAYGIISYYKSTVDNSFMTNYGLEMLNEIARFWISRVELIDGTYQILNVTGTDEHHPYVNNNAYTNYSVKYTLKETLKLNDKFKQNKNILLTYELNQIKNICENMFLPATKSGLIPQFDGYFNLLTELPKSKGSSAKKFQMKESGLYHKSQVIKQPDVMLLYSYVNMGFKSDTKEFRNNWDYYEKACESSSSLSYPVHAICSILSDRQRSFKKYFMQAVRVDIDDIFETAWQGVHSGCLAGGWFSIFRGVFGIIPNEDYLSIEPIKVYGWESVSLQIIYHGVKLFLKISQNTFHIEPLNEMECKIQLKIHNKSYEMLNNTLHVEL